MKNWLDPAAWNHRENVTLSAAAVGRADFALIHAITDPGLDNPSHRSYDHHCGENGDFFKIRVLQQPRGLCSVSIMLVHMNMRLCEHLVLVLLVFHFGYAANVLESWKNVLSMLVDACFYHQAGSFLLVVGD